MRQARIPHLLARAWILASAVLAGGCTDNPGLPQDNLPYARYPMSLAADETGRFLLVSAGNFDRTFRAGTLRMVDTATDRFVAGNHVEIPGFCGNMALLPGPATAEHALQALVPAREDDSLTLVDLGPGPVPKLACGQDKDTGLCDGKHRIGALNEAVTVGDDPIDVALEPLPDGHFRAHVVATTDGRVSIFDVDPSVTPPKLTPLDALFLGAGLSAVVVAPLTGHVYISDTRAAQLHMYHMEKTTDPKKPWRAVLDPGVPLPGSALRDYGRDLALSTDQGTLYIAWRSPNAILTVDISPGLDGVPNNRLVDLLPIGAGPAQLAVAPTGPKGGDLVYASCFSADSIWAVDPARRGYEAIVKMTHSPYAIQAVDVPGQGWKLYAALFNKQDKENVAVIPLELGATGRHKLAHFVEVAQ